MEDTESSDFLSSYDSLYSANSASIDREDQSYIDFGVVFSNGLDSTAKAEEDFESVRMIPNSRLSSADHPVLIRLENEYQARRTSWFQRPGPYYRYNPEVEGRTACPTQNNLTSVGSERSSRKQEKSLKNAVRPDVAKLDLSHGFKRQRTEEAELPKRWWVDNVGQDLPASDGDRIFAQKCRELQGFIKPLTELLNGLKRGRFERGLSSFQQSVAMDRIQRIVGVLQKPEMGERYLGTLLQVEMMLKIWFPSVTNSSSSPSSSDDDMEEPQCKMAKNSDASSSELNACQLKKMNLSSSQSLGKPSEDIAFGQGLKDCLCCNERIQVLADWPTMNLTWMHRTSICNPSLSQVEDSQVNRGLDEDSLGPSSCGIIFLVQNFQDSQAQPLSTVQTEKLSIPCPIGENKQEQHPTRSQSAPAAIVYDRTRPEAKAHSRSLPHLPTCTQRPVGENT